MYFGLIRTMRFRKAAQDGHAIESTNHSCRKRNAKKSHKKNKEAISVLVIT